MKLAVIIPHFNDVARLERCLSALSPQVRPEDEVIVVDNGSVQDLRGPRAAHPFARFVIEAQKGAAAARNRGVLETKASGIAFLDADCVPDPDWLENARRCVRDGKVVGGRVNVFDETEGPKSGAEVFETVFAFHQKEYIEKKGFSVTANLITTRDIFQKTGPMITGVSEDVDWCRRATATGAKLVYDDDLRVSHPTRSDWAALEKKWKRLTHEMFGLNGTSILARLKWAVRGILMPASALVHTSKVFRHSGLNGADRVRGIATLWRLRMTRMVWMLMQAIRGK